MMPGMKDVFSCFFSFLWDSFWTCSMFTTEGLESEWFLRHPAAAYVGQSESLDFGVNHGIPGHQSILIYIYIFLIYNMYIYICVICIYIYNMYIYNICIYIYCIELMLIAKISVCIGFTAGVTKVDTGRIAELASFQRAKCLGFLSKRVQEGLWETCQTWRFLVHLIAFVCACVLWLSSKLSSTLMPSTNMILPTFAKGWSWSKVNGPTAPKDQSCPSWKFWHRKMLGVKSAKRLAGYFPHVFPASSSGLSFQTCFFSMFYHFLTCNCDKIPRRSHQKSSEYIRVTKTSGWAGLLEGDFGIHLWCRKHFPDGVCGVGQWKLPGGAFAQPAAGGAAHGAAQQLFQNDLARPRGVLGAKGATGGCGRWTIAKLAQTQMDSDGDFYILTYFNIFNMGSRMVKVSWRLMEIGWFEANSWPEFAMNTCHLERWLLCGTGCVWAGCGPGETYPDRKAAGDWSIHCKDARTKRFYKDCL